jgi:hypothetical protein
MDAGAKWGRGKRDVHLHEAAIIGFCASRRAASLIYYGQESILFAQVNMYLCSLVTIQVLAHLLSAQTTRFYLGRVNTGIEILDMHGRGAYVSFHARTIRVTALLSDGLTHTKRTPAMLSVCLAGLQTRKEGGLRLARARSGKRREALWQRCSSRRGAIVCDMLTRLLRRTHVGAGHALLASRAFHSSPTLRAIDMAKVDTTARLAQLRKLMKERNVDIYSTHAYVAVLVDTQLMPA